MTNLVGGDQSKDIAAKIKVDTSQVSRWRTGKSTPSAESAIRFAVEYGGDPREALIAAGRLDATQSEVPLADDAVPDSVREAEAQLAAEERVLGDNWSAVIDLVISAVKTEPSEELRRSTQRIVFLMSGYLIIRILQSGYAPELEPWLERIYTEREALYRLLSLDEEPRFPWVGSTFASNADAAAYASQHFGRRGTEHINQEGSRDGVEDAPESDAQAEGDKDEEEDRSLHDPESWARGLDPRGDWGQDRDQGEDLG